MAMKSVQEKLRDALQTKQLTAITKALGEIANALAYELRPPYTEVQHFTATPKRKRPEGDALHTVFKIRTS